MKKAVRLGRLFLVSGDSVDGVTGPGLPSKQAGARYPIYEDTTRVPE